jgi:hypothetical protein
MSEWLKRDPANGYLIGPDGCHYPNEHQAAHYGLLGLCGCGSPEEAFNFCRDALACFDRRGCHDSPPKKEWIDAEEALKLLISAHPDRAAHVLAHMLSHLDLLEHGGSVGGSWLSGDGERIINMGPAQDQLDETE